MAATILVTQQKPLRTHGGCPPKYRQLQTSTHLGDVTGVSGAAKHLVHLRQLDALVVLQNEKMRKRSRIKTQAVHTVVL